GRGSRADAARCEEGPSPSARHGNRPAEQGDRAPRLLPNGVDGAGHLAGQRLRALRGAERAGAVNADDSSARDSQRSKVYAAEEFVRTLFDRAAEHGSTSVGFFGTQLTLPPEARFGSLAAVQRYIDDVLALPALRQQWPKV